MMRVTTVLSRSLPSFLLAALALLITSALPVQAQTTTTTATDGKTPLGLVAGSPAGSYALSDFDNINLYNGNLNFRLPLVHIGGRGEAQMTMMLALSTKRWRVKHTSFSVQGEPFESFSPDANYWTPVEAGYGPGVLHGRQTGVGSFTCLSIPSLYTHTLTRLTFTAADGTEYELRDQATNGQPIPVTGCSQTGASRGTVFVTSDGTAATFISDAPIFDHNVPQGPLFLYPSGFLAMKDGMRYRIDNGLVTWIRDRNGNRISFTYDSSSRVKTITDSLNRLVTVNYKVADPVEGFVDEIVFKGFGGAERKIRIAKYNFLSAAFRPNAGYSVMTYAALFPELSGSQTTVFDPKVVTRVYLPDGRTYQLYYNPYADLERIVLPAGGAIEYRMIAGSGVYPTYPDAGGYEIFRRVSERLVFPDGVNLEGRTVYSATQSTPFDPRPWSTVVTVDQRDSAGVLLARSKHYFASSGLATLFQTTQFDLYSAWDEGKETKTELLDNNNTVLRRITQTWSQRAPVGWWPSWASQHSLELNEEPSSDPRNIETATRLMDTGAGPNLIGKQEFGYDQYNNRTEVKEFAFYEAGASPPPFPVRRTFTEFVTVNNGPDYAANTSIHLRSLVKRTSVYSVAPGGAETLASFAEFEYDNYSPDASADHAALVDRPGISGHDSGFDISFTRRGNVTKTTLQADATTFISSFQKYDIAGNVVKAKDPRGKESMFEFADRFGSPDGDARLNNIPSELLSQGQSAYAVPTKTTNPLGQTSYIQYDYYIGQAVDAEDLNGVVSSGSYNDSLDRPTQVIRASNLGGAPRNQTSFVYNDIARVITTSSDLSSYGDNVLKNELVYDGLGRTIETRQYEGAFNYIKAVQIYDGAGRAKRATNPHRTTSEATYGYTDTSYDFLSRATRVETFNGSNVSTGAVVTAHLGNATTVTDQDNKSRRSITDSLGRLVRVDEPTTGGLGPVSAPLQPTSYEYDALDNLVKVTQGGQVRRFAYDKLSRLLFAANPEQTISSSALFNFNSQQWAMKYDYDPASNLISKTDTRIVAQGPFSGQFMRMDYEYDDLNRVMRRSYNDLTPAVDYGYDSAGVSNSKGRMTSVTSTVSSYTYGGYDALGRVLTGVQTTGGQQYLMSYGYDLAGNMTSETYPSNKVVLMEYDSAGRLAGVKKQGSTTYYAGASAGDASNRIGYTAHGGIATMRLGNGLWEHMNYNSRLQPMEIGLGSNPSASGVFKLDYTYGIANNNGNVQTQKITIPGLSQSLFQTYSYDELNRLQEARENENSGSGTQHWKQRFIYDRYGNRNFDQSQGQTTPNVMGSNPVISPATNRIDVIADPRHSYDPAGNLISMPDSTGTAAMEYDGENRQVKFTSGGGALSTYSYDGDGQRVKRVTGGVTTIFVYNVAGQLIAEYDDATSPPPGSGGTSYLTTDHLGSTRVMTGQGQNVNGRYDYLPFGEALGAGLGGRTPQMGYDAQIGVRQQFTQKERDSESGLDYFLARYYSASQGRFTSPDEFTGGPDEFWVLGSGDPEEQALPYAEIMNPQSINKYQYCYNNPLIYVDPDGHQQAYTRRRQLEQMLKGEFKPGPITFKKGKGGAASAGTALVIEGLKVTQVDTPAIGPADAVGAGLALVGVGILILDAITGDDAQPTTPDASIPPLVPPQVDAQPQPQTQPQAQPQTGTVPQQHVQPAQPPPPMEARGHRKKRRSTHDKHTKPRSGDKKPPGYKRRVPPRPQDMPPKPPKPSGKVD